MMQVFTQNPITIVIDEDTVVTPIFEQVQVTQPGAISIVRNNIVGTFTPLYTETVGGIPEYFSNPLENRTGISNTVAVAFSQPINRFSLTIWDADFTGGRLIAYNSDGVAIYTQVFEGDNLPFVDNRLDVSIAVDNVVRIDIVPAPEDYIYFTNIDFRAVAVPLPPGTQPPTPSPSPTETQITPTPSPSPTETQITPTQRWRSCIDGVLYSGGPPSEYILTNYTGAGGGQCWEPLTTVGFSPSLENIQFDYQRGSGNFPPAIQVLAQNPSYGTSYEVSLNTNQTYFTITPSKFVLPPRESTQVTIAINRSAINEIMDGQTTFGLNVSIEVV